MKRLLAQQKNDGFTLIELMIVVVIIGILASVAIPQFIKYQLRAKSTEATRSLGAIKTNEEAFAAKWRAYAITLEMPDGHTPGPDATSWKVADPSKGFGLLGFEPAGKVYYTYAVNAFSITVADMTASNCADTSLSPAGAETALTLAANGVPRPSPSIEARNNQNDVNWYARGDLDGDGVEACFAMGDNSGELIPVPGGSGDSTF